MFPAISSDRSQKIDSSCERQHHTIISTKQPSKRADYSPSAAGEARERKSQRTLRWMKRRDRPASPSSSLCRAIACSVQAPSRRGTQDWYQVDKPMDAVPRRLRHSLPARPEGRRAPRLGIMLGPERYDGAQIGVNLVKLPAPTAIRISLGSMMGRERHGRRSF